ncbi:MAG: ComEC/Rec2 family competence protein [Pyrinomonadaceae bacterium]
MRVAVRQAQFHAQPLALLAAAYAAGVLLAHARAPTLRWALAGGALCFVTAAVALVRYRLTCSTLSVCAAFVCAGLALSLVEQRSTGAERVRRLYDDGLLAADEPLEVTGGLARAPEVAPDGLYLALNVEQLKRRTQDMPATGTLELFAPARDAATRAAYDELELRRGARVRVLVVLEREEAFRNPGGSALTEFLARRGFDAVGTIKSPLLIERLDDERVLLPLVWLDAWREWMRARMAQMFSVETAGVLQAALLGNRYGLSRATAERFRAGGTFHVLVISGLHISFVAWLAFTLLRFVTRRRAWQFAATVLLLWAYAVAVGAGASVVRAALMFTLVALAPLVGRRASSLNVLGGVALVLLIWRPDDLFDPSFQLTFMSVVGIITLGWPLLERLRAVGAWRPTRATPYPPRCPRWFRVLGELLYWRESVWRREQTRTSYSYRLFKNPLAMRLERWHVQGLLRHACAAVLISASVQLCLLPLLVIYFHRVSAASLVLNIFVGVLMAALALTALMALALSCASLRLAHPLVWLGERLNWLMTHSVDPFARAHIASLRLPAYHGRAALVYVLYYLMLAAMLIMLARWQPLAPPAERERQQTTAIDERRVRVGCNRHKTTRRLTLAGLTLTALLSIIIAHPFSAGRADGRLRIDFLDVGQGDAALVTMPDGTTLLVDGGGRPLINQPKRKVADRRATPLADNELAVADNEEPPASFARDARSIGDAVVSEYLWWRGLDHVDYVLATHADADHMNGLNDVAQNFAVRAAFVARTPARSDEYAHLAATLRQAHVPLYLLGRGAQLRFGEVTADVLWPALDASTAAPSGNDDSLVLRLRFKERVFLLTGDIESHAEAELVEARADLRCDVVKVGHHGSRTSSTNTFVNATRPQVAVISVGRTSPFGHPDAGVVARWQTTGAQVLQTGQRGTITVSTDGHDLKVETYVRP